MRRGTTKACQVYAVYGHENLRNGAYNNLSRAIFLARNLSLLYHRDLIYGEVLYFLRFACLK